MLSPTEDHSMIIHNLTQLTKQKNEYHLLARGVITLLVLFFTSKATIVWVLPLEIKIIQIKPQWKNLKLKDNVELNTIMEPSCVCARIPVWSELACCSDFIQSRYYYLSLSVCIVYLWIKKIKKNKMIIMACPSSAGCKA